MKNGGNLIDDCTNENESLINYQSLPKLWGQFYEQQIVESILNKVNQNILGLYTDYENAASGSYTLVIGCEVSTFNNIPEGMVAKTVPSS